MLTQPPQQNQGAYIPQGTADSGTFKPVTFRQGNPQQQQQQATDLFNQRSALLQPQFDQQNTNAQQSMFGGGRLGLRLAGEGLGAGQGSGMMQPDAFGIQQAQSQALAGLAAQSTNDAFAQNMQRGEMDMMQNRFNLDAQNQYQNYGLAAQNFNLDSQGQDRNYGLSQQQQMQDYGLGQQQFGLAQQQQLQDYEMGMLSGNRNFALSNATMGQNYELAKEQNRIAAITGQANANQANYQPNWWETAGVGAIGSFAGTDAGAGLFSGIGKSALEWWNS